MISAAERSADRLPARPRPVVIVGAGGIVNDAHLPAYRAAGVPVAAVYDADRARAAAAAARFGVPNVARDWAEARAVPDAVYDVAVPPQALEDVLPRLPDGAPVLIQKPFGTDLAAATRLRAICRSKGLTAAVNFQLRYAPNMVALAELLSAGTLGDVYECEVRVNCRTPWDLWPFLRGLPRMEIALHSIHYLDLLRSFFGEPRAVKALTLPHPSAPDLASTRTSAILDYGDGLRCALSINHHHRFGAKYEASELRLEGSRGAAVARMGVNLDYPRGREDALDVATDDVPWRSVPIVGAWFPDAFRGPMCALQRFVAGEDGPPPTRVDDAWRTMALVEALYASSAGPGTPMPQDPDGTGAPA